MKRIMMFAVLALGLAACERQHDKDEAPRAPGFHLLSGGDVVIHGQQAGAR